MIKRESAKVRELILVLSLGKESGVLGLARDSAGRGEAKKFLEILTDGHGTQDVEEDERAVSDIISDEVSVR